MFHVLLICMNHILKLWHISCSVVAAQHSGIPPHTKFSINISSDSRAVLTRHIHFKQSTTTLTRRTQDILWFLVLSLPNCFLFFYANTSKHLYKPNQHFVACLLDKVTMFSLKTIIWRKNWRKKLEILGGI